MFLIFINLNTKQLLTSIKFKKKYTNVQKIFLHHNNSNKGTITQEINKRRKEEKKKSIKIY